MRRDTKIRVSPASGRQRPATLLDSVRRPARLCLAALTFLSGCSTIDHVSSSVLGSSGPKPGQAGYVTGFLGGVAADEPRAAAAGRQVLSEGGDAADAAVAVALTLAVTLPSRAGLGGGGACLAYEPGAKSPNHGKPEAILFTPKAPTGASTPGDRPAAVPMLARGLYFLHARYGKLPFEQMVSSAEQLARSGVPMSHALARDLAVVSGPLLADPGARAIFSRNGVPLKEGQTFREVALAATLAQLRLSGIGDMYQGNLAARIVQASSLVGGPIGMSDLRNALPRFSLPLMRSYQGDQVAFLPPPADGGLAGAAAFDVLAANPENLGQASERSLAVVARYRQGGVTPQSVLATQNLPSVGDHGFPASTSFVTLDRSGGAVACALTLNNLFGTGRILPGLGFLAAASPASVPSPLLAAGMVWNEERQAFRAEASASGQAGAGVAVADALITTLQSKRPMSKPVPNPGRANVIACSGYLPGNSTSCGWASDPRGSGLALGAN